MKIAVDISGKIDQKNYDSSLGFKRSDGIKGAVFLKSDTKKKILYRYKGQITNLIEKIHCVLIFHCINEYLENVTEIELCHDINFRRGKRLLITLFENNSISMTKINIFPKQCSGKSDGHWPALKAFRKRKYAMKTISYEMIEKQLLNFKESKSGR
ncbi:MAG: hypothetical protein V1870_00980 [Candidatus Aenigmatarchaeota archaeon]